MKMKKKRVGSFLCFSPPVTDEEPEKNEKRGRSPKPKDSAAIEGIQRKGQRRIILKIMKSLPIRSNSSDRSLRSTKDPKRTLSQEDKDSDSWSGNESYEKSSDSSIYSSSLSLSSTSSASSCRLSASACLSAADPKPRQDKKTFLPPSAPKNNGYAAGLVLVLLSLFVLVFCGRLCAIMWTATCLCLAPRRRMAAGPSVFDDVAAGPPAFDDVAAEVRKGREYREEEVERKRILLEGFLQRNIKCVN